MATIRDLLARIERTADCRVLPAAGSPRLRPGEALPPDLDIFYKLCGGVEFFHGADYPVRVVGPDSFVRANPVILGEDHPEDRSDRWYIVAVGVAEEAISIDLGTARLGRCYDSFWDSHGVAGSCAIIAESFSELLEELLRAEGGYWFWLGPGFGRFGDAYDK